MMTHGVVMPGLVPGIHVLLEVQEKSWMAGTSPAMTLEIDGPLYDVSMSE